MKVGLSLFTLAVVLAQLMVAGCQSDTSNNASGSTAVNPAMSAKQKAIIEKHHKDE